MRANERFKLTRSRVRGGVENLEWAYIDEDTREGEAGALCTSLLILKAIDLKCAVEQFNCMNCAKMIPF